MNTAAIFLRVPEALKGEILKAAQAEGKQKGEKFVELIEKGLKYPSVEDKLSTLCDKLSEEEGSNRVLKGELERAKSELELAKRDLANAQRAKEHLERILNIEVGKCIAPNCDERVTLYGFAFQQCPKGHSNTIELYDEYKKGPGLGEVIVAGLAVIGGVALAAELLGSKGPGQ